MADTTEDSQGAADRGPTMAQMRRELKQEAMRMRDEMRNEMREEFQRRLAEQMAQMQAQERGAHHGHARQGGPRGRRANLSREAIVATAMAIMNKNGLDKVTMRRVAHDLNTGPASLYVHVRSMVQLHGFMLDHLYATLDLDGGPGNWRDKIQQLIADAMTVLLDHPELARSSIAARPTGDGSLRFANRILELLDEGGIPLERAAWGVDLLLLYATSLAAELSTDDDEDNATKGAFQAQVATGQYPHISAASDVLFAGAESERVRWAINAILTGLAQTPVPPLD